MKSSLLPWLPSLSVSLGAATLLAACASDPVYVACPDITAPEEGVAVSYTHLTLPTKCWG